ncbi:MAG: MGMT family protein [Halodesulfurarchaeum sp.]
MSGSGIFARELDPPGHVVQIGVANGRIISLSLPAEPEPGADTDHTHLDWLQQYFAGEKTDVRAIETGLTVPTDQRRVLETIRKIPYGESLKLDRVIARASGLDPEREADRAAAREAVESNPVPIVIPTHRVSDSEDPLPADVRRTLRELENSAKR